jgi:hypothetical protein
MTHATAWADSQQPPDSGSVRNDHFMVCPDLNSSLLYSPEEDNADSLEESGRQRTATLRKMRHLLVVSAEPIQQDRFDLLQQWECTIEEIGDGIVTASIRDLTDRTQPDEIVDLPIDEFSPADSELVAPGAVFYWTIGYRTTPTGTKERVSRFRVRRMPSPTRRQIESIAREADELASLFGLRAPGATP